MPPQTCTAHYQVVKSQLLQARDIANKHNNYWLYTYSNTTTTFTLAGVAKLISSTTDTALSMLRNYDDYSATPDTDVISSTHYSVNNVFLNLFLMLALSNVGSSLFRFASEAEMWSSSLTLFCLLQHSSSQDDRTTTGLQYSKSINKVRHHTHCITTTLKNFDLITATKKFITCNIQLLYKSTITHYLATQGST